MSIVLPKTLAERQAGIKAKRNASSIPYDMVTLQYHDSLDGERLRYHDDKVRFLRNFHRCPSLTSVPNPARAPRLLNIH